jgi:hypothetical protein
MVFDEHFQSHISKPYKQAKSIPLTHKYMTAHFLDLEEVRVMVFNAPF